MERLRQIASSTRKSSLALLMAVIILGGIYGGLFTPTEAGCIAVVYAVVVGIGTRKLTMDDAFKKLDI